MYAVVNVPALSHNFLIQVNGTWCNGKALHAKVLRSQTFQVWHIF